MARTFENRPLWDNEVISQFVTLNEMRCAPRDKDSGCVSVAVGRLSVEQIAARVRSAGFAFPGDGVRYTTVGKLRLAGFEVVQRASWMYPEHCVVSLSSEWGPAQEKAFSDCFDEPIWSTEHTETGGGPDE